MKPNPYYVHLTAQVDQSAVLGEGTKVWALAVIQKGAVLGERCVVGTHTFIGNHAELGDDVRIQGQAYIPPDITIGNRVFIGPGVIFTGDRHPHVNSGHIEEPVTVEDDVSVGAHAVVLAGVRLGKGCMVGAGAVVTRDVPPGETWIGNPARRLEPAGMRRYPALIRRGESRWCLGESGRLHVTEERPTKPGHIDLVCRHCGELCERWVVETDDNVGCLQGL